MSESITTPDFPLPLPNVPPPLDPQFRPAALYNRAFQHQVARSNSPQETLIALEQPGGTVFHYRTRLFSEDHPLAQANGFYLERLIKFLLWSRGGSQVHVSGPARAVAHLQNHYQETVPGRFDAQIMGDRIYEEPFRIRQASQLPPERAATAPLGRHLDGCRIGFDLGGSDRKVAAVQDGRCLFSEEVVWDPVPQTDPQWHFDQIMESLRRAAAHLPRVDAIGGSSAGVYINSEVKVASLFRGVPLDLFQTRVKTIFRDLQKAWNGIPFEVANDGEVTALAGSMSLASPGVLGIAMGTSMAGGYVNQDGNITPQLNELAFVPVDYHPSAAVDEWSKDYGCGVQYFSQQAVGRLLKPAGIELPHELPLPEKLKAVQELMNAGDQRAAAIYQTIGVYLGYTVAHFTDFYQFDHVLLLGRVTSGPGCALIMEEAKRTLQTEFPDLAERIRFHTASEKDKRHGQAVAAASLPAVTS